MKENLRWYKNRQKKVHSRKESWFNSTEKEKIYKENFTRIKGEKDLSIYVEPKPKPKPKPKKKKSKKSGK
jgi:hypothetical protein